MWEKEDSLGHSSLYFTTYFKLLPYFSFFTIMAFSGKYELESQENYEEFLEALGNMIFINTRCMLTVVG